MKELQDHIPDKTEIHAENQIKKQKHIDKLFPLPGHRIFELNLTTGIINEVKPQKQVILLVPEIDIRTGRVTGKTTPQKKGEVEQKWGCRYVTALNAPNAEKRFKKLLGNKYFKNKK